MAEREGQELRITRLENPEGFTVVIDGHAECFVEDPFMAEQFVRGIRWAADHFGWASERLKIYGELASTELICAEHLKVVRTQA